MITSSPQAVLDSLASGGRPIYLKRLDYTNELLELFLQLNIPIIENFDKVLLNIAISENPSHTYVKLIQNSAKHVNYLKDKFYL